MKKCKNHRMIFMIPLLTFSLAFGGCQTSGPSSSNGASAANSSAPAGSSETVSAQKTFTTAELAKCNGKNGNPAYIAIDGKVYDVTNVPQWKNGIHASKFEAGKDYTSELKTQAPHDASKLNGVPIVGIMVK